MAKDLTGSRVGRFEIRARIGAGGMGEVYRAEDTKLKREVALKRLARHLRGDEHYHRSFLREAEQASALNCPSIASIYDVFEEHGEVFIVMEYVEGVNLRHRSAEATPLSEFLNLAVQCAEALVAAHEKGIVHRDIKPENIMVTASGKVKVLDFGLAKRLNVSTAASTDTQSTSFVGTPGYMAPEVLLEAKPDERADIFSLGIVFYELITGQHPFQTPALIRTADRILHDEAPPLHEINPTLPAMMESILARMLAKKPQDRYSSARDLLVDLRRLQQQTVSGARLRRVAPRRTWLRPAAVAVAVLALLVGSAWLLSSRLRRDYSRATLPSGARYVAVLPFRAIGTDPQEQAFSDGLTETVTAKLTQLTAQHGLQVAPASEVHARKVRDADDARKELGVNLVVDGSVHRLGSIVRVTLSLIDVGSGRQIQADTITAPESEAFNLEDRVVASVAGMFEMQLAPGEQQFLAVADTRSPEAHQAYLEARGYLQNYDKQENLDRAITGLKQAIAADPSFAAAYATLGEAYWRKFDISRDPRWVALGRSNCERALGIATNAGPAHTCIGMLENATGQYEGAVADFQQALAADPTSDSAYVGLAMAYEHLNNFPQAEATYRKRISLLPQYWGSYNALGTFYFRNARIDDAVRAFAKVVELVPDSPRGYMNTAAAYLVSGRYDQAIPFLDKSVGLDKGNAAAYSNLGVAYFYLRRYDQAAAAYEKAVALNQKDYIPWGNLAEAYYWAGRRDQATTAYTKAVAYAAAQIDLNPRDAGTLAALGQYHAMLGDAADARRFSERAIALAPSNADVLLARAIVLARLGEKDQATATIGKAVSLGLDPSVVRNNPVFDTFINTPALQKALAAGASKGGSR